MLKRLKENQILFFIYFFCVFLYLFLAFIKWDHFLYNAKDLAIFSHSLESFVTNGSIYNSIQDLPYFADHFTLFFFLITPFFFFFHSPWTLLTIQGLVMFSSIFLLNSLIPHKKKWFWITFFILHPMIWNIILFEFHFIPFIIPLFLLLYLFYSQKRFIPFLCLFLLTLTLREDVALTLIGFPLLAFLEKREWKWILPFFISCVGYFFVAQLIISFFTPDGTYKFLVYYGYLGHSWKEIVFSLILQPWKWVIRLFHINNIAFFLSIFVPFLFFPFKKPKFLLFILFPFLQLALAGKGVGNMGIQSHYASMLFAPLFLATYTATEEFKSHALFCKLLLIVSCIYLLLSLSPFPSLLSKTLHGPSKKQQISKQLLKQIPENANIVTSDVFLPYLIKNPFVYSIDYAYLGAKQLSFLPYNMQPIEYMLVKTTDLLGNIMRAEKNTFWYANLIPNAPEHIKTIIEKNSLSPTFMYDDMIVFEKSNISIPLYSKEKVDNQIILQEHEVQIQLNWQLQETYEHILSFEFAFYDTNDALIKKAYRPFAHGMLFTNQLEKGENVSMWFSFEFVENIDHVIISLGKIYGGMNLNNALSVEPVIDTFIPVDSKTLYLSTTL